MIELLLWIVILCILFGLIYYVVTLLPLPEPFHKIAIICVLVIFLVVLLSALVGVMPMPRLAH